ncbi:hypothetical protein BC826DRAFT_1029027 [Russula brevipes]|nr:hypothetical protein BC826DRAFT_1029027 [Russula brevipes]
MFCIGKIHRCDAGAISRSDIPSPFAFRIGAVGPFRDVLGGIFPFPTVIHLNGCLVSGVPQAYFVFQSPCLSSPSGYPRCWVCFTRRHGHLLGWIAQSRSPFDWIPVSFTLSPSNTASTDARYPPYSKVYQIRRRSQVFGRLHRPNRYSFAR